VVLLTGLYLGGTNDLHLQSRIITGLPVLCAEGWGVKSENQVEEMKPRIRMRDGQWYVVPLVYRCDWNDFVAAYNFCIMLNNRK
jgi:hypothetical protein